MNNERKVMRVVNNENKGIPFEKAQKMIKEMEIQKTIILEKIAGIIMDAKVISNADIDKLLSNFPYADRYEIMKEVGSMSIYNNMKN